MAASFAPYTVGPQGWSSTITLNVLMSAPSGTYTLPVVADDGVLSRTGNIILTVQPHQPGQGGFDPRSASCTPEVYGISHIEYDWDTDNKVRTASITAFNYCTSLYYDGVGVLGYVYAGGAADPIDTSFAGWQEHDSQDYATLIIRDPITGFIVKTVDVFEVMIAFEGLPQNGNDYTCGSDHYLIAPVFGGYYWDAYGDPVYYDPFGYR